MKPFRRWRDQTKPCALPMGTQNETCDCHLSRPAGAGLACRGRSPVAIVEDIQGKVTGAEFMDYVTPKRSSRSKATLLILSYLKSCRRETISGIGTVTSAPREQRRSRRRQGARRPIAIPARRMRPQGRPASRRHVVRSVDARQKGCPARAAAHALRRLAAGGGQGPRHAGRTAPRPCRASASRLISAATSSRAGSSISPAQNVALDPGGLYAATFKSSEIVFRVDPQAKPGATPIVGRLLRIE